MASKLRHKTVSAGVIFDAKLGFLLFRNRNWGKFAFCMKKPKEGEDLGAAALVALDEDSPLRFPEATAQPLEVIGAYGESGSVGEDTYYDYHVYELDAGPKREGRASDPGAKFFKYQDLMRAPDVTWSTKKIARAMMEHQEVSLGVVTRGKGAGRQFLLVYKPNYGYFFPTARRKKNEAAEAHAIHAVEWDTSYIGGVHGTWCREVTDVHNSKRFGSSRREFVFQICTVEVADVDLSRAGNPFEAALDDLQNAKQAAGQPLGSRGYWDWFTEDELASHHEMSPTMKAILRDILACVHGN